MNRRKFLQTLAAVAVLPSMKLPVEKKWIPNPAWETADYEMVWVYSTAPRALPTYFLHHDGSVVFKRPEAEIPEQ